MYLFIVQSNKQQWKPMPILVVPNINLGNNVARQKIAKTNFYYRKAI